MKADHLHFAYRPGTPVIQDVSLVLEEGELFGILGPNGSGKTTLLSLLAGLLTPEGGTVRLGSEAVTNMPARERARALTFVPQSDAITLPFTAAEIVAMGRTPYRKIFGFETAEDRTAVEQAMHLTECHHLKDRSIHSLSGGERRRVILARALAGQTPLIFLDEPTAHLDIHYQIEILELLWRLTRNEGRSIAVTLHDINLASLYCDRLLLLHQGRSYACGTPHEVITAKSITTVYRVAVKVEGGERPVSRLLRHNL